MDSVKSSRTGKSEALPAKSNLSRRNDGQPKYVGHPIWLLATNFLALIPQYVESV